MFRDIYNYMIVKHTTTLLILNDYKILKNVGTSTSTTYNKTLKMKKKSK